MTKGLAVGCGLIFAIVLIAQILGSLLGDSRYAKAPSGKRPPQVIAVPKALGDYRWAHWGDSPGLVKATEEEPIVGESPEELDFHTEVGGLHCEGFYSFTAGQLTTAGYLVQAPHVNKNLYLEDFSKLKEVLTTKYGTPVEDRDAWSDELYRDTPKDWGMAVAAGHLVQLASWRTPETTISEVLRGDNFKITLMVVYRSIRLAGLAEAEQRKRASKGL